MQFSNNSSNMHVRHTVHNTINPLLHDHLLYNVQLGTKSLMCLHKPHP